MKAGCRRIVIALSVLSVACVAFPAPLRAQAAPGPLHPAPQSQSSGESSAAPPAPVKRYPAQKKENLVGSWRINPDESDDARQKIEQVRNRTSGNSPSGGNNPNAGGGNNPYPGSGGGNGPYGRPGGGSPYPGNGSPYPGNGPSGRHGGSSDPTTYEDRQQLQDLIESATSLTFTQKEGEVDVTDDQNRKRVYFTGDRKPQKSNDANYREAAASWQGARLVAEEKGQHGGRITRSYEITPDGSQLDETVRLDSAHMGLISVRYVFDLTSPGSSVVAPAAK